MESHMSESRRTEIVLRPTPGRDATAAELARSRGEFRRQPHLTAETITIPVADAEPLPADPLPAPPAACRASSRERHPVEYGRGRMYH
jgi:hypothetical protein